MFVLFDCNPKDTDWYLTSNVLLKPFGHMICDGGDNIRTFGGTWWFIGNISSPDEVIIVQFIAQMFSIYRVMRITLHYPG
jgi:hypothetical protein